MAPVAQKIRIAETPSSVRSGLSFFLESLQRNYHRQEFLSSDPLEFVHRFQDPWDQEAVALIAALLAYGNVKQIRRSVEDALRRMRAVASTPKDFVQSLSHGGSARKRAQESLNGFVHRFNRGEDLSLLLRLLSLSWKKRGSLGSHFVSHLSPGAPDIGDALNALIDEWKSWLRDLGEAAALKTSFSYLLTAPRDGSCCKRWCMFLRWMGRMDAMDPGLWAQGGALAGTFPRGRALRPDQLVMPLDTHTGRISQYLGLTARKSLNWAAALEITRELKLCDPRDPTRYDFALARLGILDICQRKYNAAICESCDLRPACRFAARGGRSIAG